MKIRWILSWVCAGMLCVSTMGFGQDFREQAPLLLVGKDTIDPASGESYFEIGKKFTALYKEHNISYPVLVFTEEPPQISQVSFVVPLTGLGYLEEIHKEFMRLRNAAGEEKVSALEQQAEQAMEKSSLMITAHRPDLSYIPEDPFFTFDPQKPCVTRVDTYFIVPGQEKALEALGMKIREYYKEKGIRVAMDCYQIVIGPDMPTYEIVMSGPDEEGLDAALDEFGEQIGPEYGDMLKPLESIVRRRESKLWYYKPDLSYFPE